MKRYIIFSILLGAGLTVFAQSNKTPVQPTTLSPQEAYEQYNSPEYLAAVATNDLIKELGLTGEQREKVYCAKLTYLQEKRALIKKHERVGGSSMAARLELYEYRKTCNREIRSTLNPVQAKKFESYLARTEGGASKN